MEIRNSQINLTHGLNGLPAGKKVWVKPTVELISHDKIASGNDPRFHEASLSATSTNQSFVS